MSEPDVTLTDYALALECAVFCVLLLRQAATQPTLRRWWAVFFATVGLAALIGGTVHGFVPDSRSGAGRILWAGTLLTLGVTSVAAWMIGSYVLATGEWLRRAAMILFVAYAGVVLFVRREFLVAIAMYMPATIFLLVALIVTYRRTPNRGLALGIGGLVLTFVAAAVQQTGISIHPVYFNHNALYHAIQFVALWMLFAAARSTQASSVGARIPDE